MAEFEIIQTEEQPYLYVERRSVMGGPQMGEAMSSAFQQVWEFMQSRGIAPAGPALSVYYDYGSGEIAFRAGFAIGREDLGRAEGEVESDVTPATRAVHTTHRGSYDQLRTTYAEMFEFVTAQQVQFTAPTWELYRNSPDEVAEDDLVTDCYQALAG